MKNLFSAFKNVFLIFKFFSIKPGNIFQSLGSTIICGWLLCLPVFTLFFISSFAVYSITAYSIEEEEEEVDAEQADREERAGDLLQEADNLITEALETLNELGNYESDEESDQAEAQRQAIWEGLGIAKNKMNEAQAKFADAQNRVGDDASDRISERLGYIRRSLAEIKGAIQEAEDKLAGEEEDVEPEPTGLGPCDPNALAIGGLAAAQVADCCMEGMTCEIRIRRAVNDAKEVCSELREKAFNCCYEPASCLPGGEVTGQIANVAGLVNSASGDSMSETCKKLKQSFGGFSSINAFMAVRCKSKARKCSSKCSESIDDIDDAFRSACGVSIDPSRGWRGSLKCDQNVYEDYQLAYEKLEDIPGECREVSKESNRQTAQMASQLAGLFTTAKACKLKLADEEPIAPTPCTFGCPTCTECVEGLCQPKQCGPCQVCMAGNGECIGICIEGQTCNEGRCVFAGNTDAETTGTTDPELINPALGDIEGIGGGGRPDGEDDLSREISNEFGPGGGPFTESDFDITDGGPPLKPGQAGSVGGLLGGTGGGGGGGLGGGGAGGGGGGGDGYGGGGEGDAAPNDILQGFKSGKFGGYGGGGKGGHKGYGRAPRGRGKAGKKKKKQAKLDLKDLIPKDKKLDKARGKFGSIHDNIFQRVSNRFQLLCRKNKMRCR